MAIFGQFTKRAQQVLMTAQECATREGQPYVGTLHFLYGLLDVGEAPESVTRHIQKEDVKQVLDQIDDEVSLHPGHGPVQMTPRARRVLDGSIGAEFLQDFTAQGRVGLSWYDAGARSFYARQPVRSLNDLQGKTIRVQDSQIVIDMIRLLGAVPETTAYSDVYSALETGQIDAAENNWPAYYSMEHYKVARYYMADEHSRVPEVQLASGRTWDALPEEYRQTLQACARASAQYERQLWAQEETAARKAALAGGCQELPLPEEEMQNFRQLVQPLYRKYCADYLPLVEEIQAE